LPGKTTHGIIKTQRKHPTANNIILSPLVMTTTTATTTTMTMILPTYLLMLLLCLWATTTSAAFMMTPNENLCKTTKTTTTTLFGYVPDGMSPEQWRKLKEKEKQAKTNKDLGAYGPSTFQSRSLRAFQQVRQEWMRLCSVPRIMQVIGIHFIPIRIFSFTRLLLLRSLDRTWKQER
jgi:hypothetical protein